MLFSSAGSAGVRGIVHDTHQRLLELDLPRTAPRSRHTFLLCSALVRPEKSISKRQDELRDHKCCLAESIILSRNDPTAAAIRVQDPEHWCGVDNEEIWHNHQDELQDAERGTEELLDEMYALHLLNVVHLHFIIFAILTRDPFSEQKKPEDDDENDEGEDDEGGDDGEDEGEGKSGDDQGRRVGEFASDNFCLGMRTRTVVSTQISLLSVISIHWLDRSRKKPRTTSLLVLMYRPPFMEWPV